MKIFFLVLIPVTLLFSQQDSNLTFSEIMFCPQSGNNEFIELYNLSGTESFDLSNIKIKYYTSSPKGLTETGYGFMLKPESFAVIFEGDYDLGSGIYKNKIPPDAIVLKVDNNSFGTSGMSNTYDRPVYLLNGEGDTLDTYMYSANNSSGISDEKIRLDKDNSPENWGNSKEKDGTPGYNNSIAAKNYDLSITAIQITPEVIFPDDVITINAEVKNIGKYSVQEYKVDMFIDANKDSIPDGNENFYSQTLSGLKSGDSIVVATTLSNLTPNNYSVIIKVNFDSDGDSCNNILIKDFIVNKFPAGLNDIVINEIMYAPVSGEPEWVELYNRSEQEININNWKFSDNSKAVTICKKDLSIPSKGFLILSKDSSVYQYYSIPASISVFSMPALNNTGDIVLIKDSYGVVIDSLEYFPEWGGNTEGKSLERISCDLESNSYLNWQTSCSRLNATPGMLNSVTPKDNDLAISSFTTKKKTALIGQPFEIEIIVRNKGKNIASYFTLNLYKDLNADSIAQQNELLKTFNETGLMPSDSSKIYFEVNEFSAGKNYLIAEIKYNNDEDTNNNVAFTSFSCAIINEIRNDLIINEFMYAPTSPEPEWVEIYNRSKKIIDLKNYSIADSRDAIKVVNTSVLINPDEYFVISKDSSIFSFYDVKSKWRINSFPSLNNTGDKIILIDSLGRTIDSLEYTTEWGGKYGRSLERISTENSSINIDKLGNM